MTRDQITIPGVNRTGIRRANLTRPLRVLHVIPTLETASGGPLAILFGLAASQVGEALDVSVLATFVGVESRAITEQIRRLGVNVTIVGPVRGKLMKHPALAESVRRGVRTADIVHIHGIWEELQHQTARACRRFGVPYIVSPHGMLTTWSLARRRWAKRLFLSWRVRANLNAASRVHFLTATECQLTAPMGLRPSTLVQAGGCLRLTDFDRLPARGAFRRRVPQIGNRPLILFMGRIALEKGLRFLIPAMRHVRPMDAILAVVGPDARNYRATLQAEVNRLGLCERIIFTGMLVGEERIEALADADLFCAPSDHESLGVAIIEALAAGLPSVVSEGVGIHREIVRAGVGAVAGRGDTELAGEISRWLQDDSMRRGAAARCRPFVRARFGPPSDAQGWDQTYRGAIARKPQMVSA